MEKIKCIVLDDDLAYCEKIALKVSKHPKLELSEKFTNPEKAKMFLMEHPVPLVFIDMEMPGITGIDFLKALPYSPYAIIISGHPDFAIKAFELEALDYILKPFEEQRFYSAVNKAADYFELKNKAASADTLAKIMSEADDYFFVRSEQNYIKLKNKDVLYIEALDDFVKINIIDNEKPVTILVNLKQLENTLASSIFMRIHKSYIININYITSVASDSVMMGSKMIPVGPSFKEAVTQKIINNKIIRR